MPNCVLEAMACGRPVVATNVGGTREAVVHGETGILVQAGDPHGLAMAIDRVLGAPGMARAMGEAGRRRVAEQFTIEAMVSANERMYEELAEQSG